MAKMLVYGYFADAEYPGYLLIGHAVGKPQLDNSPACL